jgi:protoheme IX farnesyltransferase
VFAGGFFLLILGLTELAWLAGLFTASLAAAGAAYYIFVYTLILKRRSAHGVVPGGLAGLFPLLVAWSATGVPADRLLLFICAFVFLWSPPHFWALALAKGDDYRRAGFPTLRDTRGEAEARLHILLYVTGLLSLSFLPLLDGMAGPRYLVGALAAAALLSIGVASLFGGRPQRGAWLVYKLSGPYLALILAAMVLDRLAGEPATVALW